MSWNARRRVLARSWQEAGDDDIALAAAGVAFYAFLALVPLLGAIVLSYGIVAEPSTVVRDMHQLTSVMPADTARLIGDQLMNVVETSGGKKGFGLVLALAIALFGARNGAGAIVTALNIAYEEKERRTFFQLTMLALAMTAVAVVVAVVALVAIAALGHLEALLPALPDWLTVIGKIVFYMVFTGAVAGAAATLYRYGPSHKHARWAWITPGSLFTAISWLILTIGFGAYVARLGQYEATYGSLGTVMVLLTWLYLSSYVLLFGAEINSEFELQEQPAPALPAAVAQADVEKLDGEARPDAPPPSLAERDRAPQGLGPGAESAARFAVGRVAASAGRLAGFGKVDLLSSGLAAFGLARVRHAPTIVPGIAMLAGAGMLAWLRRDAVRHTNKVLAILFDLDGTLVDSNDRHVEAWREAFQRQGHDIEPQAIHDQIGKGGDLLIPALVPGVAAHERKLLSRAHDEIFKGRLLATVKPFPDARALLEAVHRHGQKVVLASSASREEVQHYIRLLDAQRFVDAATSIDDVGTSKPAPDIFESALKKIGVGAEAALVVGDTPYDIEAAAKCGVAAVAVRSGGFGDEQLVGSVAIFDDVAALLARYDVSPLARGRSDSGSAPPLAAKVGERISRRPASPRAN